jgi:hypothetical protein
MNYEKEIQQIEEVLNNLKLLKKELLETQKKSTKAFDCIGTIKQREKLTVALNWQCMALDKQRKATWKAIVKADLKVSLEDTEYNPSAFHKYNHVVI